MGTEGPVSHWNFCANLARRLRLASGILWRIPADSGFSPGGEGGELPVVRALSDEIGAGGGREVLRLSALLRMSGRVLGEVP